MKYKQVHFNVTELNILLKRDFESVLHTQGLLGQVDLDELLQFWYEVEFYKTTVVLLPRKPRFDSWYGRDIPVLSIFNSIHPVMTSLLYRMVYLPALRGVEIKNFVLTDQHLIIKL